MSGDEFPDDIDADSIFTPDGIDEGELFHILSNKRRRLTLYILREAGAIELTELADRIASIENNDPVEEIEGKERKRVYISLYQTHLPKLEEVGFVDFDVDKGIVEASDELFELDLNITTSNEKNSRILDALSSIIILVAGGTIILALAPTVGTFSINAGVLSGIMAFLSSVLVLLYYYEKRSGPNIEDVVIGRE